VPRAAVAITLPTAELGAVREHLDEAGFEAVPVESADELERLLGERSDIRCAVLDGETDFDTTLEMYAVLREDGRSIPVLMLIPPRSLGRIGFGRAQARDEYFTRPYSAESLRWRIEAMLIRVESVTPEAASVGALLSEDMSEPASGQTTESAAAPVPVFDPGSVEVPDASAPDAVRDPDHPVAEIASPPDAGLELAVQGPRKRGRIVIVFNPKGGVGKTTISINMGAALQIRKGQRVLLVDCDTITGHIAASLGLQRPRTLADAWRESAASGLPPESVAQIATVHESGVSVLVMAESPLHTEILEPPRVAQAIIASREAYDWVILDMHPDYGPLNQSLFEQADTILVPVTPDVPCIRAAVQFRELAVELAIRDRLTMVINRANSGVSASDVERVVAIPDVARIRSAGLLFVRAADEGKSAVERFPEARVVGDVENLAEKMLETAQTGEDAARSGLGSHNRIAETLRGFFDRISTQVS